MRAPSLKQIAIDRANASVVAAVAIGSSVTIFCFFASRALLSQKAYQDSVIAKKEAAAGQLSQNVASVQQLKNSYDAFISRDVNMINGSKDGATDRDGDNAKITLDALPGSYDFPALATSLEKIMNSRNVRIESINGNDDEIAQKDKSDPNPQPVQIPFRFAASGSDDQIYDLLGDLQRSIRPFHPLTLSLVANTEGLRLSYDGVTYYTPAKSLSIKKEVLK